jgi:hypothetical protein
MYAVASISGSPDVIRVQKGMAVMIFTRRFGALAARPQFPDAPDIDRIDTQLDLLLRDLEAGRTSDATSDEPAA